jgi:hypothetical protein
MGLSKPLSGLHYDFSYKIPDRLPNAESMPVRKQCCLKPRISRVNAISQGIKESDILRDFVLGITDPCINLT